MIRNRHFLMSGTVSPVTRSTERRADTLRTLERGLLVVVSLSSSGGHVDSTSLSVHLSCGTQGVLSAHAPSQSRVHTIDKI